MLYIVRYNNVANIVASTYYNNNHAILHFKAFFVTCFILLLFVWVLMLYKTNSPPVYAWNYNYYAISCEWKCYHWRINPCASLSASETLILMAGMVLCCSCTAARVGLTLALNIAGIFSTLAAAMYFLILSNIDLLILQTFDDDTDTSNALFVANRVHISLRASQ